MREKSPKVSFQVAENQTFSQKYSAVVLILCHDLDNDAQNERCLCCALSP